MICLDVNHRIFDAFSSETFQRFYTCAAFAVAIDLDHGFFFPLLEYCILTASYLCDKTVHRVFKMLFYITFPYGENSPSCIGQLFLVKEIILDIPFKLFLPELHPALRHIRLFASRMSVPEAYRVV